MIRFATMNDIPNIMKFIDKYWRKNHIMSRDMVLFEFQHKWDKEISFVISETDRKITGLLGYIPYATSDRDVTLAIWKTNKTTDTMQGINILSFLRKNGDVHTISAPGINPKTISIYKFLGMNTGMMQHWYRLRPVSEYKIAKVINYNIPKCKISTSIVITEIPNYNNAIEVFGLNDCLVRNKQLYKSEAFIKRRYFSHPSFEYLKYGLIDSDKKLFIVMRIQKYNESAILRIIDCLGDHELLPYFTSKIDDLMSKYNCEYADCYETGVSYDTFIEGGWQEVTPSGNIMPDYFAPFEQRNINIYYMSEIPGVSLFKGDGDMDRPN